MKATSEGSEVKVTPKPENVKEVNIIIDRLLSKNYHRFLIDFENHMDSAVEISRENFTADFTNSFISQAILDCTK